MQIQEKFHERLRSLMDNYVHFVYKITKKFPKLELYGATSQLRRASLSVILNYIEGYTRGKKKVHKNFLEISYASLKESKYLPEFSFKENFYTENNYKSAIKMVDEIGAMLWGTIRNM